MINDPLSPEEQTIIQQIQAVPKLELGSAARDAIRERILNEFRAVSQQSVTRATAQTRLVFLTVVAVVVVTLLVIIAVVFISSQNAAPDITTATPITLSASPETSPQPDSETPTAYISFPTIRPSATLGVTDTPELTHTSESSVSPIPPTQVTLSASATSAPISSTLPSPTETDLAATSVDFTGQTPMYILTTEPADGVLSTAIPTTPNAAIIVIEGPVVNIANNIITIYDFEIEVEVNHPILNLIEIGDLVRIEGVYGTGNVVAATVVSNLSSTPLVSGATVSLDGPVESINGNIIVVNGIAVQLAANDPLLQTVQVGQFVSVQGNFQGSGSTIVLVVVTVIVNTNVTATGNDCWYHENGMSGMGHWHCDGSGMGMGNNGMENNGMGMGMGN